jgi:hypothetical protein
MVGLSALQRRGFEKHGAGRPSTPRVYQRAAWRTVGSGPLGGIGFGLALGTGTSVFGARPAGAVSMPAHA